MSLVYWRQIKFENDRKKNLQFKLTFKRASEVRNDKFPYSQVPIRRRVPIKSADRTLSVNILECPGAGPKKDLC